ncbi:MAG TPA: hypothetical protein VFL97_08600 [Nitrococcus sp.]|jgi:hypothetical protein|nr:hypothetical protein [Nitrococcus sp.]
MKRPVGMTLLAVALAWLAMGGVLFSVVSPILAWAELPWMLYEIAGLAYAASATVAAVGVWKLEPWAYRAFQVWLAIALAAGSLPLLTFPTAARSRWMLPVGWALLLVALWPFARYIRRNLQAAA